MAGSWRWSAWVLLALGTAASAELGETAGRVDEVTVYRGQALVSRVVEIDGPGGIREIAVVDLPSEILSSSLHAESSDGVAIRSVRYRVRPVAQDVRAEVSELDRQIQELNDAVREVQRKRQVVGEHRRYLGSLESFVAPTATVELTKGVLDAGTLQELSSFLLESRRALAEEELQLEQEDRAVTEQLSLLQRQRAELSDGSARTVREAVLLLDVPENGGTVRLRYLVNRASWAPSYNVRAESSRADVLVEYNASIQQQSGEDWDDVRMTLSTATPSLVAKAPTLDPMTVRLVRSLPDAPQQQQQQPQASFHEQRRRLVDQQRAADVTRNTRAKAGKGASDEFPADNELAEGEVELNRYALRLQELDLVRGGFVRESTSTADPAEESVSVVYRVPTRTSLPSRSDRQIIRVASLDMKSTNYKVATPLLTDFVYDEAELSNGTELVLLAGPVSTYRDGEFVGHGAVPTVAAGESFTVGLGVDSSMRARRELVSRAETIQGGNRVVDLRYRLLLDNFGARPADVRLIDRLPHSTDPSGVFKLTLLEEGFALSDDPAYQKDRKQGLLRWDVNVPAGGSGLSAFSLEYGFRMEFDKELTITGLEGA